MGERLPEGWRWTTLGDVADPGVRAIVSGPFGSNIGSRFFVDQGVPVIRGNNLTTDMQRFIDDGFVFVTEEKANELGNCDAIPDDLVFTAAGSLGQVGLIPKKARYPRYIISNKQLRARVDKRTVDPLFAFYWFASKEMVLYIQQRNTGSSVPLINLSVLRSLPLPLPPLSEQRAIAHILGTLDDKIELNRRMSETLEAMARALFKSWFVDFDPIRAKIEGHDPNLPGALADLSPSRFVASQVGDIPEGWDVCTLGDLMELAYGRALKEESRRAGSIRVFGSNGQIGWHDKALVNGPGITVGRKGNPGIVTWAPADFYPIDTAFYVIPKARCPSLHFLFHVLSRHDLPSLAADSAVPGLNRHFVYGNLQVVPPLSVLKAFDRVSGALSERRYRNERESHTLSALRDILLPRLISGTLRVKDAEEFVG